ncbi:hypothetical protein D9757_011488 [Collybiopsis confluens]|uniref:HAT C-terminal dimerisation domain-containing protein n=1 Tax=Collybiopsis confluens TaxID=2823264 RepID=A0A8H5GVY9_9AGAR|nr:hypothetical protein D9757_011488 [Collybiopsis confluens]
MSDDNCAVAPDGSLKDAADIDWQYDPDPTVPPPSKSLSSNTALAPGTNKTTASDPENAFTTLMKAGNFPVAVISEQRRSHRDRRPSNKVREQQEAQTSSSKGKRKASPGPTMRRTYRRTANGSRAFLDTDPGDDSDSNDAVSMVETEGTEPASVSGDTEIEDAKDEDGDDGPTLDELVAIGASDQTPVARKSTRTLDVYTVFEKANVKNPDTGKVESGHICGICRKKNIRLSQAFFTGSVTTLRRHISRHKDHFIMYRDQCAKRDIPLHPAALPSTSEESISRQSTLDSVVTYSPRLPEFSTAGLLDYCVELVVAFRLVDTSPFRQLLQFSRGPSLKDKDIPSSAVLRKEVLQRANLAIEKIKQAIASAPGKVSFTFDSWTSDNGDPYLSVTGHYIASGPMDRPNNWSLKCEQLAFEPFHGHHSGVNMANVLVRTIDRYGISHEKTGWFTADNASNNDTAVKHLAETINARVGAHQENWDAKQCRLRCMEHCVHLSAGAVIKEISPTSNRALMKKIRQALFQAEIEGKEVDLDALDCELAEMLGPDGDMTGDGEDDDDDVFSVGDTIGKVLAFIKQIRMSPQARAYFKECCKNCEHDERELLLWIRTRWASLEKALRRLTDLQRPVNLFIQTADDDEKVPKLKDKNYSDFKITRSDWEKIKLIQEVLAEPAKATQTFSSVRHPTLAQTIPTLEYMRSMWSAMSIDPRFDLVTSALDKGIEAIDKWYSKVDDTNAHFITLGMCESYFWECLAYNNIFVIDLALDPTVKLAYVTNQWHSDWVKIGVESLEKVFDKYYVPPLCPAAQPESVSARKNQGSMSRYGMGWMMSAVRAQTSINTVDVSPREELDRYLKSPLEIPILQEDESQLNVIRWWGHHQDLYPTLSRIARDYLAIQGSATPSERAFSGGALTGTKLRNSLRPEMFQALQILKGAYRNGHISATQQAAQHIVDFMAALDEYDFGDANVDLNDEYNV